MEGGHQSLYFSCKDLVGLCSPPSVLSTVGDTVGVVKFSKGASYGSQYWNQFSEAEGANCANSSTGEGADVLSTGVSRVSIAGFGVIFHVWQLLGDGEVADNENNT